MGVKLALVAFGFAGGMATLTGLSPETRASGAIVFVIVVASLAISRDITRLRIAVEDSRLTPEHLADALRAAARRPATPSQAKAPADGPPPIPTN